ncbi:MAG: TetR family transcriptional regulator [Nocardioidaceae bacterium]
MDDSAPAPSPRRAELLEAAYRYALEHGLADLSLRPLATAIGSSPRVLLYLFGSKEGLIRALLARARAEEVALLDGLREAGGIAGLAAAGERVWSWLSAVEHRPLVTLWVEGYARSLVDSQGPWAGFARESVDDWLAVLAAAQHADDRDTAAGRAERTALLAVLRGALLDLLATGDVDRTTEAVRAQLGASYGSAVTGAANQMPPSPPTPMSP